MWSSSPKKSEDPAEEAQADYHFQYVGKELHCRSEYLFSGDWQTVTKLALKARDERPLQPGFRVKKIAERPGGRLNTSGDGPFQHSSNLSFGRRSSYGQK